MTESYSLSEFSTRLLRVLNEIGKPREVLKSPFKLEKVTNVSTRILNLLSESFQMKQGLKILKLMSRYREEV